MLLQDDLSKEEAAVCIGVTTLERWVYSLTEIDEQSGQKSKHEIKSRQPRPENVVNVGIVMHGGILYKHMHGIER